MEFESYESNIVFIGGAGRATDPHNVYLLVTSMNKNLNVPFTILNQPTPDRI